MKYRRLGSTGIQISEIGFGAWGIGGTKDGAIAYGPTDDGESASALQHAFELGVTFFDTAALYGFGHSERLIGQTLKGVRSQIIIATKVGLLDHRGAQDFSPPHIKASVEASLKRLQTDYVDLLQLHSPVLEILDQDDRILAALRSLQAEGKIRAFGISVRSPNDGLDAVSKFGAGTIQVNFNLADQRALEVDLFALCGQHDVGVIIRTPLCFGFLTGQYSTQYRFDPLDNRSKWSVEQITRWAQAYQLFSSSIIEHKTQTHAQIALRFCLSHQGVSTVIPGMLTRRHVAENVQASHLGPLTDMEVAEIRRIYHSNRFFVPQ